MNSLWGFLRRIRKGFPAKTEEEEKKRWKLSAIRDDPEENSRDPLRVLVKREAYGVGRLNDTVADVAWQLVLRRERDDEVARRRVILVPKKEVGERVKWLFGFEWGEE